MVLLVLWLFMVSRMELGNQRQSVLVANQPDSVATQSITKSLLQQPEAQIVETVDAQQKQPAIFQGAFTTFLVMFVILGIVWLWSKKKSTPSEVKQTITELGHHVLGQGSQLKIVDINNEVWVLGVSSGAPTLLHRYTKDEWNANSELMADTVFPKEVQKPDFKAVYSLFGN